MMIINRQYVVILLEKGIKWAEFYPVHFCLYTQKAQLYAKSYVDDNKIKENTICRFQPNIKMLASPKEKYIRTPHNAKQFNVYSCMCYSQKYKSYYNVPLSLALSEIL
jgi:hypothetical protein